MRWAAQSRLSVSPRLTRAPGRLTRQSRRNAPPCHHPSVGEPDSVAGLSYPGARRVVVAHQRSPEGAFSSTTGAAAADRRSPRTRASSTENWPPRNANETSTLWLSHRDIRVTWHDLAQLGCPGLAQKSSHVPLRQAAFGIRRLPPACLRSTFLDRPRRPFRSPPPPTLRVHLPGFPNPVDRSWLGL